MKTIPLAPLTDSGCASPPPPPGSHPRTPSLSASPHPRRRFGVLPASPSIWPNQGQSRSTSSQPMAGICVASSAEAPSQLVATRSPGEAKPSWAPSSARGCTFTRCAPREARERSHRQAALSTRRWSNRTGAGAQGTTRLQAGGARHPPQYPWKCGGSPSPRPRANPQIPSTCTVRTQARS